MGSDEFDNAPGIFLNSSDLCNPGLCVTFSETKNCFLTFNTEVTGRYREFLNEGALVRS
jgi:hypothetical protein